MADVLEKNWNANKIVLTNLSICLVTLLIQGVGESPQLLTDLLNWGRSSKTKYLPMLRVLKGKFDSLSLFPSSLFLSVFFTQSFQPKRSAMVHYLKIM